MHSTRFFLTSCGLAALLAACGGSQPPIDAPRAMAQTGAIAEHASRPEYIYVVNTVEGSPNWASDIDIYRAGLNGNVSPVTVIGGSQTRLTEGAGIVVDRSGEIYVADIDTDEIVGFPRGSSGNAAPNVVISGSETELSRPTGLALDAKGNLYVGNCASGCGVGSQPAALLEFAAGSNGNVAPIRNISGPRTGLANSNAPAVDARGDIYVSNWIASTIDVFARDANGDAKPIRELAGPYTLLDGPDGIAVDGTALWAGSANEDFLERFKPDARGDAAPLAIISGRRARLGDVDGIALDLRGYVYASNPGNRRILGFKRFANGDVRPVDEITGSNTKLVRPEWVFVK